MRRLFASVLLASVSFTALAQDDSHIAVVPYSPTRRTDVIGIVNHPTTITFPKGEFVLRFPQSQHPDATGILTGDWSGPKPEDLGGDKDNKVLGQSLPLWPTRPGTTMMTIITRTVEGVETAYPFRLVALPDDAASADAPNVVFNVIFRGTAPGAPPPSVDPGQHAATVQARVAKQQATELAAAQTRMRADAFANVDNVCHYTAKGRKPNPLTPRCPIDNGEWTVMRFPGLTRKPSVYIPAEENCQDERLARQHGDGDFVVIEEIARRFCLRLGNDVLEIIHDDTFDPAGRPSPTGTSSPWITREIISAPPHS